LCLKPAAHGNGHLLNFNHHDAALDRRKSIGPRLFQPCNEHTIYGVAYAQPDNRWPACCAFPNGGKVLIFGDEMRS
jgi:hypothetical protein